MSFLKCEADTLRGHLTSGQSSRPLWSRPVDWPASGLTTLLLTARALGSFPKVMDPHFRVFVHALPIEGISAPNPSPQLPLSEARLRPSELNTWVCTHARESPIRCAEVLKAPSPCTAAGPCHAFSALSLVAVPGPKAEPPSPQLETETRSAWSAHPKGP